MNIAQILANANLPKNESLTNNSNCLFKIVQKHSFIRSQGSLPALNRNKMHHSVQIK